MPEQTVDKQQVGIWTFKNDWAEFKKIVKDSGSTNTHIFREMLKAYKREQKLLKAVNFGVTVEAIERLQTEQERPHGGESTASVVRTGKNGKGA